MCKLAGFITPTLDTQSCRLFFTFWAVKAKPKQRLAVAQAGSRYTARSVSACGFGWPHKCYKAQKYLAGEAPGSGADHYCRVGEAAHRRCRCRVGGGLDPSPSVHTVYLIKICVCDLCVGSHAEPSAGWQQHMGTNGEKRVWRSSEEGLTYFVLL